MSSKRFNYEITPVRLSDLIGKSIFFGGSEVHLYYPGAGHAIDNIVTYIPTAQTLFGGCLLKSLGSGKGNLADADTEKWSATVKNVQDHFPNIKFVVPGHGKAGNTALLEFTIGLFNL
jgi:metallo-beta-lactamase class B